MRPQNFYDSQRKKHVRSLQPRGSTPFIMEDYNFHLVAMETIENLIINSVEYIRRAKNDFICRKDKNIDKTIVENQITSLTQNRLWKINKPMVKTRST